MTTKAPSKPTRNNGERASTGWGTGSAGFIAAAAVAGAAVGIAANYGRKLVVQGLGASGDWVDGLAAEHAAVLPCSTSSSDRRRPDLDPRPPFPSRTPRQHRSRGKCDLRASRSE